MNAGTLGSRLREARRDAGLSTRATAQRLKDLGHAVSHVTVSKYERNEFSPTHDTLVALASVLGKEPQWFEGTSSYLAGVRFRALKTMPVREKTAFTQRATPWLRLYVHVHDLLGRKVNSSLQVSAHPRDSGRALAKRLRDAYGLGDYPIPSVTRMLENANVRVIQLETVNGIDAFAGLFGEHRVVVVNRRLPPDRMRLTLAHELGHVLFDDCTHERQVNEKDLESRVFEFASYLLMPTRSLEEAFEIRSMVRLVQYKERFGISLAAMVYRAKRERLIPESMAQRLWREFSRLGWRRDEPGRVPTDDPVRMETLVDSVLRQKQATLTELSRVSGLTTEDIHARILDAMRASELTNDDTNAPSFQISKYMDGGAFVGDES